MTMLLILIMLFSQTAFGEITMISPGNNAIVYGGDFYLSIKISGNSKLRVTIYEEQTYHIGLVEKELIISGRELSDAQGNPVTSLKYKVQSEIYEKYTKVDTLNSDDLLLLAAKDSKSNKGKALSNGQELSYFGEAEYKEAVEYKVDGTIGLYTYDFHNVETGIYKIFAEEINSKGKTVNSESFYIIVKDGEDVSSEGENDTPNLDDDDPIVIPAEPSETSLFQKIMNFLKSIFK